MSFLKMLSGSNKKRKARSKLEKLGYLRWMQNVEAPYIKELRDRAGAGKNDLETLPLLSIIMPVYRPNLEYLKKAVESLQAQIYPKWELCLADDCSGSIETEEFLRAIATNDQRVKVVIRQANGHISAASNSALALACGEFVVLMDQDDLLAEHALLLVAQTIQKNPGVGIIYSDEDKITDEDERIQPFFKPNWNLYYFRARNMVSHLGVYRRELVIAAGGFTPGMEGSQDYDLALRIAEYLADPQIVHIPQILYHWRVHSGSTSASLDSKPYAVTAAEMALNNHFERCGINARAHYSMGVYRPIYGDMQFFPSVVIVIKSPFPNKEKASCYAQKLIENTGYPVSRVAFFVGDEMLVCALDEHKKIVSESRAMCQNHTGRIENINYFGKSAIEQYICFVAAALPRSSDWLSELVNVHIQQKVGCVGAKMLAPNERVLFSGFAIGAGCNVFRVENGVKGKGYFLRQLVAQEVTGVSSSAMLVSQKLFNAQSGFDGAFANDDLRDVDFCLGIRKAGYRVVLNPYAAFTEASSKLSMFDFIAKRKPVLKDRRRFVEKWDGFEDPFYTIHGVAGGGKFRLK